MYRHGKVSMIYCLLKKANCRICDSTYLKKLYKYKIYIVCICLLCMHIQCTIHIYTIQYTMYIFICNWVDVYIQKSLEWYTLNY